MHGKYVAEVYQKGLMCSCIKQEYRKLREVQTEVVIERPVSNGTKAER